MSRGNAKANGDIFPAPGDAPCSSALEAETTLQFGQVALNRERAWHRDNLAEARTVSSPAALRAFIREAPFRPLATSADLPSGWQVALDAPEDAHAVIETIYPGLLADWAAKERGTLETESLEDIGRRQSGMFKDIHRLPKHIIQRALEQICGNCVRQPIWQRENGGAKSDLPCRAPCNTWLTSARKLGEARL